MSVIAALQKCTWIQVEIGMRSSLKNTSFQIRVSITLSLFFPLSCFLPSCYPWRVSQSFWVHIASVSGENVIIGVQKRKFYIYSKTSNLLFLCFLLYCYLLLLYWKVKFFFSIVFWDIKEKLFAFFCVCC